MAHVFVLDMERRSLSLCHPALARRLLTAGTAAVFRRFPFTVILKHAAPAAQPDLLRLKIDPGGKTTGLAIVHDRSGAGVLVAELSHRSQQVYDALLARQALRRLTPALAAEPHPEHPDRDESTATTLPRWSAQSGTRGFDTQLLQNAEIGGIEYEQGELACYEVREYLLEKWGRAGAYCGAEGVPLEVEHIIPRTRVGSNWVNDLTLACHPCDDAKGRRASAEFGHPEIQQVAQQSLKHAAAVSASRWALYHRLVMSGLPVEVGTGGRTKWNRA
jgi:5-methylcytosine-specific restriction endonuclease McrA